MNADDHSTRSAVREKLIEHLMLGELLKAAWLAGHREVEVLKPEVDQAGYDLVLESRGVVRHVQLKSSFRSARTSVQKVHLSLARKPGGCVLWVYFDRRTLELGPFLWFGGGPGEKLPSIDGFRVARHTRADAAGEKKLRPAVRVIPKRRFRKLDSVSEVLTMLFGAENLRH